MNSPSAQSDSDRSRQRDRAGDSYRMLDRYSSPQRMHRLPARSQWEPHFESPGLSLLDSVAVPASDLAAFSAPVARPNQKTDCSPASPAVGPKVWRSPLD